MKSGRTEALPRLYIGNLPYSMDGTALVQAFASYGIDVGRPHIVMDKETGQSKGFGFVELKNAADLETAISTMNGSIVGGRTVKVDRAHERTR